jgi:3-oxoacyl-[acyl-carrier-protein] synthase-3
MFSHIKAITYHLPENTLTNKELAELYSDWTEEKITEKTGISERHIAADNETALDLAVKAIQSMFDEEKTSPEEIDFILMATQSPDYLIPTTACILQAKTGIPKTAGALDINLGCSAFIYGLALSKSLVGMGVAGNVLLVTAETYSKHIHPMDKSTRTIFGDGAAATLISQCPEEKIGSFVLGTDGSGAENLIIPASGARIRRTEETKKESMDESGCVRTLENIYMNGPEILNFTIDVVPKCVREVLLKHNMTMEDIDLFVFHQANRYILDYLRRKLKIPEEKFYINIKGIGNTVSATIPIALSMAQAEGRLKSGNKVMLVGFGVGLSWGATIIEW